MKLASLAAREAAIREAREAAAREASIREAREAAAREAAAREAAAREAAAREALAAAINAPADAWRAPTSLRDAFARQQEDEQATDESPADTAIGNRDLHALATSFAAGAPSPAARRRPAPEATPPGRQLDADEASLSIELDEVFGALDESPALASAMPTPVVVTPVAPPPPTLVTPMSEADTPSVTRRGGALRFNFDAIPEPVAPPAPAPAIHTAPSPAPVITPEPSAPTLRRRTRPDYDGRGALFGDVHDDAEQSGNIALANFFDAHVPAPQEDDVPRPRRIVPATEPELPRVTPTPAAVLAPELLAAPAPTLATPVAPALTHEAPSLSAAATPTFEVPRHDAPAPSLTAFEAPAAAASLLREEAPHYSAALETAPEDAADPFDGLLDEAPANLDLEAPVAAAADELETVDETPRRSATPRPNRRLIPSKWAQETASAAASVAASAASATASAASAAVGRARTAASRMLDRQRDRQRSRVGHPRRNRRRGGVSALRPSWTVGAALMVAALLIYWALPGTDEVASTVEAPVAGSQVAAPLAELANEIRLSQRDAAIPASAGPGATRSLPGEADDDVVIDDEADADAPPSGSGDATPTKAKADRDFYGIATLTASSPQPERMALRECRPLAERGTEIRVKVEIDERSGTVPEVWVGDSSMDRQLRHCIVRQFKKATFEPKAKGKLVKQRLKLHF
ncbi:MAG: hypothetical protein H6711_05805 [Myxococcales bacterium]|nr:hypothetical protein [Myxococcales bacterium]